MQVRLINSGLLLLNITLIDIFRVDECPASKTNDIVKTENSIVEILVGTEKCFGVTVKVRSYFETK